MTYDDAVKYYTASPKFLATLGNDSLLTLLDFLGNPQDSLDFIHVAGTNGKGSVSIMIAETLSLTGKKVGLFTSPYITCFNERIRINGKNISDTDLIRLTKRLKYAIDCTKTELSSFAKITALAFMYFSEEKCDIVVLETGLGGRLDATNVIKNPKMSVITRIAFDHTEYLGNTISEITAEKCGIIKPKSPVFTISGQVPDALSVIADFAEKNGSKLILSHGKYDFELGLDGEFQKENASLAEAVLKFLGVPDNLIRKGFMGCKNPARFEFLQDNLLIDGAHNPNGISALLFSLKTLSRPVHFIIAMMQDKSLDESARLIEDFGGKITVTEIDNPRCIKAETFAKCFKSAKIQPDAKKAVFSAVKNAKNDELVCVLGSLYLAGEIRKEFLNA